MLARLVFVVQFFSACVASLYDLNLEVDDLQSGLPVPMTYYKGKVLLIVNVASQCGFTQSTYSYLNTLHSRYGNQGLAILAFPCNQFGAQEPGSPQEIFSFATTTQSAKFDLFRKVDVNGPNAHPLFQFLRGVGDCSDEERDCEAWAESGECENNKEFMEGSCRLSCGLCTPSTDAGAPVQWNFESFLVTKGGTVHKRFATGVDLTARESTSVIEMLLAEKDEL